MGKPKRRTHDKPLLIGCKRCILDHSRSSVCSIQCAGSSTDLFPSPKISISSQQTGIFSRMICVTHTYFRPMGQVRQGEFCAQTSWAMQQPLLVQMRGKLEVLSPHNGEEGFRRSSALMFLQVLRVLILYGCRLFFQYCILPLLPLASHI